MRLWPFGLLLLLVLTTSAWPSWAGVVEDSEGVLQTLPSDNPAQRVLDEEASRLPRRSTPDFSDSSDSSGRSSGTSSGRSRVASGSQGPRPFSPGLVPSAPEESPLEQEARRRREARSSSDRALTLGGVFLLLMLVLAAALYGRRAERND